MRDETANEFGGNEAKCTRVGALSSRALTRTLFNIASRDSRTKRDYEYSMISTLVGLWVARSTRKAFTLVASRFQFSLELRTPKPGRMQLSDRTPPLDNDRAKRVGSRPAAQYQAHTFSSTDGESFPRCPTERIRGLASMLHTFILYYTEIRRRVHAVSPNQTGLKTLG